VTSAEPLSSGSDDAQRAPTLLTLPGVLGVLTGKDCAVAQGHGCRRRGAV
jgi:hypothetical protein